MRCTSKPSVKLEIEKRLQKERRRRKGTNKGKKQETVCFRRRFGFPSRQPLKMKRPKSFENSVRDAAAREMER